MNHPGTGTRQRTASQTLADPDLVDRLARLRAILPLIATDLATTRHHATSPRAENENLRRRIAQLDASLE